MSILINGPAEKRRQDDAVAETGDREEFGDALENPKNKCLTKRKHVDDSF
jgi:hypothetical protein